MMAAVGTLVFLSTLWMLVVVGAAVLEESGGKIAAALKGHQPTTRMTVPVRMRSRLPVTKAMRVQPRWRAAA